MALLAPTLRSSLRVSRDFRGGGRRHCIRGRIGVLLVHRPTMRLRSISRCHHSIRPPKSGQDAVEPCSEVDNIMILLVLPNTVV